MVSRALGALAGFAGRRPLVVLVVAAVLGAAGAGIAVALKPTASAETFVGKSSASYEATQSYYSHFGQAPVDVLVRGNVKRLVLSSGQLERLAGLEGCLAGRVPAKAWPSEGGIDGPCARLAKMKAVRSVIGPGTFVAEAAGDSDLLLQARERAARREALAAERAAKQSALRSGRSPAEAEALGKKAERVWLVRSVEEIATIGEAFGVTGLPSIEDRSFVSRLVFGSNAKAGTPKARFAYVFPSREAALISVRLKSGVGGSEAEAAIADIRSAIAMPQWRLKGASYLITGEPAIVAELSSSIARSIVLLLIAAAVVMALALGLVFRGRPRLLPLILALLACALTFGGLELSGAGLSIGEVAVLPVLIGLAVDYAIQLQSRMREALQHGGLDVRQAVVAAASTGGPAIAAAAAASGGAMLVLELSPVPTVRDFATLLVIGLAVALVCVVSVGSAAVVLLEQRRSPRRAVTHDAAHRFLAAPFAALRASWAGAQEAVQDNSLTRAFTRVALGGARRRPGLALAVGLLLAVAGFAVFGRVGVQTDITKLVPQGMTSLRNLTTLERASGVGGEIDLMVSGADVGRPSTIEWMRSYENEVLRRFGYSESAGCGRARLCPAFSLPSLFTGFGAATKKSQALTGEEVSGLLSILPPYFSRQVITANRRVASLAFGLRLMPLGEQQRIIEAMRASLKPPPGVHASLVGLPVLAAEASSAVGSTSRRVIELLAGLAIVALVLLLAFRGDVKRALPALVPVGFASGWSALLVYVLGIPLNPMSVTLSALTIAVSTEFSVLLSERYRAERAAGFGAELALQRTWSGTGAAIAASGVTAIAGFGVLALSDIAMLRDFGLVTLVDLTVSLLGVLLLLPGTLLIADDGRLRNALRISARRGPPAIPLRRRRRARHGTSG